MKTLLKNPKVYFILIFLTAFVFIEVYAQYGTSRRVARRTSRRTSRRMDYRHDANYGAGTVATLPGGCALRAISGIDYQYCGGVYYRPYYQGTQVVYVVENP